jgi:hypothetical protein
VALIQADTEGLQPMANEANAALAVARKGVTDRTVARQHAVTELSTAEDRVLLAALVQRARYMDAALLDVATRISTVAIRLRCEPWVATHELRTRLYMDAAQNPRLAEAGRPGSKWPALRSA